MNRNILETVMGAVVLVVAVMFLVFAYSSGEGKSVGGGYQVTAKFDHIEGTRAGGDVRISGIKVGSIVSQVLDPKTFQAIVTMSIDKDIKLPTDTVATITSAGLLGDKMMTLVPGADDKTIPDGGEIKFAQSPVSLESLLGQFVFSVTNSGKGGQGGGDGAAPAAGSAPAGNAPAGNASGAKPPASATGSK